MIRNIFAGYCICFFQPPFRIASTVECVLCQEMGNAKLARMENFVCFMRQLPCLSCWNRQGLKLNEVERSCRISLMNSNTAVQICHLCTFALLFFCKTPSGVGELLPSEMRRVCFISRSPCKIQLSKRCKGVG